MLVHLCSVELLNGDLYLLVYSSHHVYILSSLFLDSPHYWLKLISEISDDIIL
jgi:hypothetical protein